ncbi:hypothetical protein BWZ22_04380 [Seonamhaeicola sp. S2-3]|uniref:peptidylprolyl isomerase n=1 Tax=Seonamhaeicola sp. S2-3 TaxID=1936081 RepID=UPI000972DEF3|nr:peptidylprolyl isomerase [Seonamhaeicola sp. S2-3]APY10522.1 hypothetical protein BWZ22_04380 [Seonamhaeicola sp. S2-3]
MLTLNNILKVCCAILLIACVSCKDQYPELDNGLYAEINTTKGTMVAKLAYKKAPVTVANFVSLAEANNPLVDSTFLGKKFYDGLTFHRVIDSFIIQTGKPIKYGMSDAGYRFNDEFDKTLKHDKKGILAMANPGRINSNGSQFYITQIPTPWLDAYDEEGILKFCEEDYVFCHSVFGEVILGLNVIDSIKVNDVITSVNIIRKGSAAINFDAPKVFINHFAEEERKEQEAKEKAEAIIKKTKKIFDEQLAKAITLPSGLQYYISKKGEGKKLPSNAIAKVHYAVYYENGKLIETSNLKIAEALYAVNEKRRKANKYQPITADIGPDAQMIPGFKEGLQQLHVGDKATLFLPYYLAYGEAGNNGIPPKSNLIFEVEVLELLR